MTTAKLAAALVAAQADAGSVAKDARNEFHRYDYASAEAMIREARDTLSKHGLALLPIGWALRARPDAAKEAKGAVGDVLSGFVLLHSSGEERELAVEWPVVLEKGRPEDKAVAGALTTSLAYLLRGLLLLPREDEEAAPDQRDDRDYDPGPTKQRDPRETMPQSPPADPAPSKSSDADMQLAAFRQSLRVLEEASDVAGYSPLATKIKAAQLPPDAHNAIVDEWVRSKAKTDAAAKGRAA